MLLCLVKSQSLVVDATMHKVEDLRELERLNPED
jgi:hypothetical protein